MTATLISNVITNVPNGGKDTTFGIGLPRFLAQKAPNLTDEQTEPGKGTELVGIVEMEQLTDGNGLFLTGHEPVSEGILLQLLAEGAGLFGELFVGRFQLGLTDQDRLQRIGLSPSQSDLAFQRLLLEPEPVHVPVDGSNANLLEVPNLASLFGRPGNRATQSLAKFGVVGQHFGLILDFQRDGEGNGGAILEPFQAHDAARIFGLRYLGAVDEFEAQTVDVLVGDEQLPFLAIIARGRLDAGHGGGPGLALGDLTTESAGAAERIGTIGTECDLNDAAGPKRLATFHQNQTQQEQDHE
jgi:hypothetical protein